MKNLISNHYSLFAFIVKSIVITACLWVLLNSFCPRYYFTEFNKRCNMVSGVCEMDKNYQYTK